MYHAFDVIFIYIIMIYVAGVRGLDEEVRGLVVNEK